MRNQKWWDNWFLGLAQYISTASKDPSTKCGAIIVDTKRRIVSTGYNGFPRGIEDKPFYLKHRKHKYPRIVHAEINAILFAQRDLNGCTLYTWPFGPCDNCCKMLIQTGLSRVVAPKPSMDALERWGDSLNLTREMFKEAGIEFTELSI